MKPPIFVDENGDTAVFLKVEDAEVYLEPIDVENEEYVAYDSEGTLLELLPTKPRITIRSTSPPRMCVPELRQALCGMLSYSGVSEDWLKDASLEEIVEKAKDFSTK
jgi:hypothetical protein